MRYLMTKAAEHREKRTGARRSFVRAVILTLILLLLPGLGPYGNLERTPLSAAAIYGADAAKVEVTALKVSADHTLEVGLDLTCADFKSAGVVLAFNRDKLTPIGWDEDKTPLAMPADTELGFGSYTQLEVKGADDLSSQIGLAYLLDKSELSTQPETIFERTGYLYLGAESMAEPDLSDKRAATLRFDYAVPEGSQEEQEQKRLELEEALQEETLNTYLRFATEEEGADTPAGAACLLVNQGRNAKTPLVYSSAAAESPVPGRSQIAPALILMEAGDSVGPGVQTYSLLYGLMGGTTTGSGIEVTLPEGGTAATTDPAILFRQLDGLAAGRMVTIPNIQLYKKGYEFKGWYPSTALPGSGVTLLKPGAEFSMPEGNLALSAVFRSTEGGGGISGIPIIFYDWDGTTLLGSVLADKSDFQSAMDQFTMLQMPEGVYEDGYTSDLDYYNDKFSLTAKKGYSFDRWVDFNADVPTSFGEAVGISSYYDMAETIQAPDAFDVSSVEEDQSSIVVKAAYKTNCLLDRSSDLFNLANGTTADDRQYKVSESSFDRFGYSDDYAIRLQVERKNEKNEGVYRTREMGLRITMEVYNSSGGTEILYALQKLENQDVQEVEIAVNANSVIKMSASVVDLENVSNWAAGTTNRSNEYTITTGTAGPGTDGTGNGYLVKGSIGRLNALAEEYLEESPTTAVVNNNNYFTTPGFDVSSNSVVAGATGNASNRRLQALKNIIAMFKSVIESEGSQRDLDWHEINDAIRNGATYPTYNHP